jgi:hypothetical protein
VKDGAVKGGCSESPNRRGPYYDSNKQYRQTTIIREGITSACREVWDLCSFRNCSGELTRFNTGGEKGWGLPRGPYPNEFN